MTQYLFKVELRNGAGEEVMIHVVARYASAAINRAIELHTNRSSVPMNERCVISVERIVYIDGIEV